MSILPQCALIQNRDLVLASSTLRDTSCIMYVYGKQSGRKDRREKGKRVEGKEGTENWTNLSTQDRKSHTRQVIMF